MLSCWYSAFSEAYTVCTFYQEKRDPYNQCLSGDTCPHCMLIDNQYNLRKSPLIIHLCWVYVLFSLSCFTILHYLFRTSRPCLYGDLIECDFCPLSFHTNCLQPPLTNKPAGLWMCPNHAEHAEVTTDGFILKTIDNNA